MAPESFAGRHGIFANVDEAVRAAQEAFEQLERLGVEGGAEGDRPHPPDRDRGRRGARPMEFAETKIGRLDHKIEKLKVLGEKVPGVEFMQSEVFSGDHGLAVIEHAPFGVIGAITPVTHSLPTIACNAINMIAGGNTVVVNPASERQEGGRRGRAPVQSSDSPRHRHRQPHRPDRRADARESPPSSSTTAA
jgi:aldehyde dehydrogenase